MRLKPLQKSRIVVGGNSEFLDLGISGILEDWCPWVDMEFFRKGGGGVGGGGQKDIDILLIPPRHTRIFIPYLLFGPISMQSVTTSFV